MIIMRWLRWRWWTMMLLVLLLVMVMMMIWRGSWVCWGEPIRCYCRASFLRCTHAHWPCSRFIKWHRRWRSCCWGRGHAFCVVRLVRVLWLMVCLCRALLLRCWSLCWEMGLLELRWKTLRELLLWAIAICIHWMNYLRRSCTRLFKKI